jgi:hypothetical protein
MRGEFYRFLLLGGWSPRRVVNSGSGSHYDGDVNLPAFITAKNLKPFIPKELYVTSSPVWDSDKANRHRIFRDIKLVG